MLPQSSKDQSPSPSRSKSKILFGQQPSNNSQVNISANQISLVRQPVIDVQQLAQQSSLFQVAFGQRKRINLQRMNQHCKLRNWSYGQRSRIFIMLQGVLKNKIECTKLFIKDMIKYFEQLLSLYGYFYKSMSKLQLRGKSKQLLLYDAMVKTVHQLTELNYNQIQRLKVLTNWLEKILLPALKAIYDMYRDEGKKQRGTLQDVQSEAQNQKQKEIKNIEKVQQGTDLLETELQLVERFVSTDNALIKWGTQLLKSWQQVLKKQGQLREQLQKNMVQFHDKFTRVYMESEVQKNLLKFWMEIDNAPTVYRVLAGVLGEKDLEYIHYGFKSEKLKNNFEGWLQLRTEQLRVGNPMKLVQILLNKKFTGKLQKSQREYIDVRLYFTVDANLLMFDQGKKKLVMKLTQNGLTIRRLSENLVQLKGVEIGFLIDSKKKQTLHFGKMDEAEEFIFFVENLLGKTL